MKLEGNHKWISMGLMVFGVLLSAVPAPAQSGDPAAPVATAEYVRGQLLLVEGSPVTYQAQQYDASQNEPDETFVLTWLPDDDIQPLRKYGFRPKIQESGGDGGSAADRGQEAEKEAVFTVVDLTKNPPEKLGTVTLKVGDPPAETPTTPSFELSVTGFATSAAGVSVCTLTVKQTTAKARIQACAVDQSTAGACSMPRCSPGGS